MRLVAGQGELALARQAISRSVATEVLHAQKDMLAAFNLACNVSGLEDKEIYIALDIDAGQWSRIKQGGAHFPLNKLEELCDVLGNEILLEYLAWKRGKGVHQLETETERQLRLTNEALQRERDKNKMLTEILQGKA